MFRFLSIILGLTCATLFAEETRPGANNSPAVTEFMQNFDKALNSHNPAEIANFWAPNGDLMTPWGRWMMGRTQIQKYFESERSGPMSGSMTQQNVDLNRQLSPDLISVDATVRVAVPDSKGSEHFLLQHGVYVLTKIDGQVKILSARLYEFQTQDTAAKKS